MDGSTQDLQQPTLLNPIDYLERLEVIKISLVDKFQAAVQGIIATEDLAQKRKILSDYQGDVAKFLKDLELLSGVIESADPVLNGNQQAQQNRIKNLTTLFTMQSLEFLKPMEKVLENAQNGTAHGTKQAWSTNNSGITDYIGGRVRKEEDGKMVNPRNAEYSWGLYKHVAAIADVQIDPDFREKMEVHYPAPALAAE